MYYCPDCRLANETGCCRACGRRGLREARSGDFCYLTTQTAPWTQMLQEVLENNGVVSTQRLVPGAWAAAYFGSSPQNRTEFFVPYEKLAGAQLLVEELFDAGAARDQAEPGNL